MRKYSFPPVVDPHVKVLILGSLPGEESLRQTQYYAHSQNRFWELVGGAIDVDLRSQPYEERLATLLAHRIGLWDVIADAHRRGSLDSAIRDAKDNDVRGLVASLPNLEAIAFNGRKASENGRKQLGKPERRYRLIDLPSSSPAFAAMSIAEKQERWAALAIVDGIGAAK